MHKLAEIRNQELICRERALSDPENRELWLAKAKEWGQRALDEIVLQFRESNGPRFAGTASNPKSSESPMFDSFASDVGMLQ
jgi:hypothetical protein